jgi:hypothetical protein
MLKSKTYYARDKFLYIIELMKPMLPKERKQNLIEKWDNDDELTIAITEATFVAEEEGKFWSLKNLWLEF